MGSDKDGSFARKIRPIRKFSSISRRKGLTAATRTAAFSVCLIPGMHGGSLNLLNCRVQSKSEIFEDYGLMKFEPGGFARGTSIPANHRREYIR